MDKLKLFWIRISSSYSSSKVVDTDGKKLFLELYKNYVKIV